MFGDIKSIAELAVRDWCRSIGLDMHYIKLLLLYGSNPVSRSPFFHGP